MRKAFVTPAAYLILKQEGKILLARRANTGYADGWYQPPSGHIEEREAPSVAALREAMEEVGITAAPEDIKFVHVAYPLDKDPGQQYVDFFFMTEKWSGEVTNMEPEKCDELLWVSIDELPENTVGYIKDALLAIERGEAFSEFK